MTTINIFFENIHPEIDKFPIEQNKNLLSVFKKIFRFFLKNKTIFEGSCLKNYSAKNIYFDIVFCDEEKIHEINRKYRQKDRSTDVITFALFADSPENERFAFDDEINLGEIFISLDNTRSQANDNNHSFEKELFFLIAHGIMHLLGYDHQDEKNYKFMIKYQNEALENINV